MALFKFTKNIIEGRPIAVFNNGQHLRDFTYVTDIAEGIIRANDQIPEAEPPLKFSATDPGSSYAPFNILNIGGSNPIELLEFIKIIEKKLGKKAKREFLPLQPGDIESTKSDVSKLRNLVGYVPSTPIEEGISNFIDWYKNYYKVDV
jgi:UDP-glucuronate 4-epimerase